MNYYDGIIQMMQHNPKTVLGQPLELPCGVTLKNRLVKSAMSDSLGDGTGNPTDEQIRLYERWGRGWRCIVADWRGTGYPSIS